MTSLSHRHCKAQKGTCLRSQPLWEWPWAQPYVLHSNLHSIPLLPAGQGLGVGHTGDSLFFAFALLAGTRQVGRDRQIQGQGSPATSWASGSCHRLPRGGLPCVTDTPQPPGLCGFPRMNQVGLPAPRGQGPTRRCRGRARAQSDDGCLTRQ